MYHNTQDLHESLANEMCHSNPSFKKLINLSEYSYLRHCVFDTISLRLAQVEKDF